MQTKGFFQFGEFRFDPAAKVLYRGGKPVPATPKVLDTLHVLLEKRGQLVEKSELMQAVWPDTFVEENNLSQNISALRKILAEGGSETWVETVPRRGFRMTAPVEFVPEAEPPPPRRRWMVYAAGAAALGAYLKLRSPSGRSVLPLLVMPVKNLGGKPIEDYAADGITEGLIAELARVPSLRVISRTSAMALKDTKKPRLEIARELGVEAVLEPSIEDVGGRLKVEAALIDARSGQQLWALRYTSDPAELAGLQARLIQEVRSRLAVGRGDVQRGTASRGAYEEYLRGRYEWNKRSPDGVKKALEHFRAAIDLDPVFAAAFAGMADCYNQLGTVQVGARSPRETRTLAAAAARRAIELDEQLPEAHAALAMAVLYDWHWEEAGRAYQRALELNPGLAQPLAWYAIYLMAQNRMTEAVEQARRAVERDPLSGPIRGTLVWILDIAGLGEEAIAEGYRTLDVAPGHTLVKWRMGMAYTILGQDDKAISLHEECVKASGRSATFLDPLGEAYARSGRTREAAEILEELTAPKQSGYQSPVLGLHTALGLGRWDVAYALLERSVEERTNYVTFLRVMPREKLYANFRAHERFQKALRRTLAG